MGAGLGLPGRDPAVETWREAFAAMDAASTDPAVHAVADDARHLLIALPAMSRSEVAAMAEEFRGATSPGDVVALLRVWRMAAGLYAAAAGTQNGAQGLEARSGAAVVADDANGSLRPARGVAWAIPGPSVAHASPHSAAETPPGLDAPTETPDGCRAATDATDATTARVAATEDHTDTQES